MELTDLYELRDDVYRRPLFTALQRVGLGPGWRVADVGAGNGDVSVALASQVGRDGRVYAVDIDPRRRDEMAARASLLSQVIAITQAAEELALPEKVDLVFARFLLLGVSKPKDALKQMVAAVKPRGWIVLQEPVTTAGRVDGQPIGADTEAILWPDIGADLPHLLGDLDVDLKDMWAEAPVGYRRGPEIEYLSHMTDSGKGEITTVVLPPLVTVVAQHL
ncbi:Methyltransferase domain-containing protein [Ferrithrix thermotolerans DSM 19514]|uniref:Methyltransferase domain-containing protein n=1 Tax=Ferrithrix thermotolerans DSM 19514 TaxID=1121881 RepID=A0A1M4VT74_9ACTN|nr:methyltransferase domain-containing protein [Ferrithrix thermotolerans]SHE72321.1 Methyltransferase domain-containing protein [Ferrithrix thermotolerans DSM 19514]